MRVLLAALVICSASSARADFSDLYANALDVPLNKAPKAGRSSVVLIPVQVDFGTFQPVDIERLRAFFETTDEMSFRRYFEIASGNRYHPSVTVAPLVEYAGCPASLHGSGCSLVRGNPAALAQDMDFVRDVFRRAHEEGKVDFGRFDVNGAGGAPDGVVDGAMIVINVPDSGVAIPIQYVNSGSNLAGGTGGALVLDGVKIPYVAIGGAGVKGDLEYPVLRQFGALLGLADLSYDHPSGGDRWPAWQGLHFSMMGDWDQTDHIALPDAESRRALGWQLHEVVSGTQTLTLLPAGAGGISVKLGMISQSRREYFLAEVRGPAAGVDTGIVDSRGAPTWGLALYHVDWSKGPKGGTGEWPGRMLFCLDCDPYHPFVQNLESDGAFALVTHGGVADDAVLFEGGAISSIPGAQPLTESNRYLATNWYDGSESGIAIRDVRVNADHSVTATFTAPAVADPCSDVVCGSMEQCADSGALAGNCVAVEVSIPDAGVLTPPVTTSSGCSSTGGAGVLAMLIAGLGLTAVKKR
ncbi:MAG: hypothetical protein ABR567_16515 [Myxococcales bacterium]|nr:immune inhibitor A [Myxococcales bacterium]